MTPAYVKPSRSHKGVKLIVKNKDTQTQENSPVVTTENLLQRYKVGKLSMENVDSIMQSITATSSNLFWDDSQNLIEWKAVPWFRYIVEKNQSCIVVGEDGIGKSATMNLAEPFDDNEHIYHYVLPCPCDTDELYWSLWHRLDRPLPRITDYAEQASYNWKQCYICKYCKRKCTFTLNPPGDNYKIEVAMAEGHCPLIIDQVHRNIENFSSTIVVKVPDIDNDLLDLLVSLLKNDICLVLLANHDQLTILQKKEILRRLPVKRFPMPNHEFFFTVTASILNASSVDVMPITVGALKLLILISRFNPGMFVKLFIKILEEMRYANIVHTVDENYVIKVIAVDWDEGAMIIYALSKYQGNYVKVRQIRDIIKTTFGIDVKDSRLGRKLANDFGLESRRNNGAEYQVPNSINALIYRT